MTRGHDETAIQKYEDFDLEVLQEEADKLPQGGTDWWKPKTGKNYIRLLPGLKGHKPFKTWYKHWFSMGGERKAVVCTAFQFKQPCAICEEGKRLQASGNTADRKRARAFNPQASVYVNMVDLEEPEKGVQVWQMPKGVYGKFVEAVDASGAKNIAHPTLGRNLVVKRKGTTFQDTEYTLALREPSPLANAEEFLGQLRDLEKLEDVPSDEELDEVVDTGEFQGRDSGGGGQKGGRGGGRRGKWAKRADEGRGDPDYDESENPDRDLD